jgi:hypothetical protein
MLFSPKRWSGSIHGYLVISVDSTFQHSQMVDRACQLIQATSDLAQGWMGGPVETLAFNAQTRQLWRCSDGIRFSLSRLTKGGIHLFMNAGFLLSDQPTIAELSRAPKGHRS